MLPYHASGSLTPNTSTQKTVKTKPEAVKDMLRKVNATRRGLKVQAGAELRNFAPIQ